MRKTTTYQLLVFAIFFIFIACSKSVADDILPPPPDKEEEDNSKYGWEKNRTSLLENNDMVLLYAGGSHRPYHWDEQYVEPYVTYKDESGKEHWMFDSFLFLEIYSAEDITFATGYKDSSGQPLKPAKKQDWERLIDHYFQSRLCIGALEKSIESAKKRIGEPTEKRKIVIGIPEPIKSQKNWGSVREHGTMLDFSRINDRITACEWYIDYAREKFNEMNFKNIELAGFYWIAETASDTKEILSDLSSYLNKLKYSFVWIPYNGAHGAFDWKRLTFNYAYYQPNYFFNDKREISWLNKACEDAVRNDMDMEIEFDDRVLERYGWGYRLDDYMNAFKEYGIWENRKIAYYQGGTTVYNLSKSKIKKEKELYHRFGKFVIERPN